MRTRLPRSRCLVCIAAGVMTLAIAIAADAANIRYMNLRDLVAHADRIVRGTVVASEEGTVSVGGGTLPIVTYRIRVEDALKGSAAAGETIEVSLLGQKKETARGPIRNLTLLRDLPRFTVGRDYLFILTRPSQIGLSTTVGLGQGLFQLQGRPGAELAANEANNLGLFSGIPSAPQTPGPIAYVELAKQIQTLVGR
jgi:hypothetical protein